MKINQQYVIGIIGFGLILCLGVALFYNQTQEGMQTGVPQTSPMQYIRQILSMYENNKITAAAAQRLLKYYMSTIPIQTPELEEILETVHNKDSDSKRMSQIKNIFQKLPAVEETEPTLAVEPAIEDVMETAPAAAAAAAEPTAPSAPAPSTVTTEPAAAPSTTTAPSAAPSTTAAPSAPLVQETFRPAFYKKYKSLNM